MVGFTKHSATKQTYGFFFNMENDQHNFAANNKTTTITEKFQLIHLKPASHPYTSNFHIFANTKHCFKISTNKKIINNAQAFSDHTCNSHPVNGYKMNGD